MFHEDHFKCKRCNKSLVGAKYVFFREKPFCEECHVVKLTDRCAYCREPIHKDKIIALGQFWCVTPTSISLSLLFFVVKIIPLLEFDGDNYEFHAEKFMNWV